jgi:hypothetical protein
MATILGDPTKRGFALASARSQRQRRSVRTGWRNHGVRIEAISGALIGVQKDPLECSGWGLVPVTNRRGTTMKVIRDQSVVHPGSYRLITDDALVAGRNCDPSATPSTGLP